MVAARPQRACSSRRAAQTGGRELLSGWSDQGGYRALDRVAAGSRARARDRILHGGSRSGQTFTLVPYNQEYQNELAQAAALLRDAAGLATEPTLKAFLTKRADAFLSNDYYDSDVAWMDLKGAVEPTIGPYEVYEDEWFNYKAAFESFITVQDEAESAKLQKFAGELQDIENHLPIDPKHRNPKLGASAPIVVVNEIYAAGDANHGVQTAAFNLPNDERVVSAKGSKRVMLKNVQDAKFAKILTPISKVVLTPEDQKDLAFEAFFTHILVHELMHGLGPHNITAGGRQTTVRQELKETSSAHRGSEGGHLEPVCDSVHDRQGRAAEIARAAAVYDVSGVDVPLDPLRHQRSARAWHRHSAQHLMDKGAVTVRPDGTFAVDPVKAKEAVTGLTRDIMTIQAEGNYAAAKELRDRMGVVRPPVQAALDKLTDRAGRHRAAVHDRRSAASPKRTVRAAVNESAAGAFSMRCRPGRA